MKARIDAGTNPAYIGIKYDPRWKDFSKFLEDVGSRPEGMTLDRIDPLGHYTKENTRWANAMTQANNKARIERYTFDVPNGLSATAAQWARMIRKQTGNPDWTARRLKSMFKLMSVGQILLGIHPAGMTLQALADMEAFEGHLGAKVYPLAIATP